ncbi:MAG: TM0996/MTH895 family glutaredoxin-like protein [Deltaproteobacteria bacterium]|nr:TM0996/MTH895 family glutaredoxin-like protein [Deltaproteobacteria bacterium]MBW2068951.1 TM0996/MTH895 family glutaredoxin-like protein [Deltaproteobacteria bacterium]
MEIKVLGPGCKRCQQTEQVVSQALQELGITANLDHVKDPIEISNYGVFGTPAVVVNGEVKCVGKVPSKDEVKKWLQQAK